MMYYQQSLRTARSIRTKALAFTVVFHLGLAGWLAFGSESSLNDLLPETVAEWLGLPQEAEGADDAPRP